MENLHRDGRVFLSSTTINGQFVIQMAILSFRTKVADDRPGSGDDRGEGGLMESGHTQ